MIIETLQLQLIPYAPGHLLALIEGNERFAAEFGRPAAEGLRALFVSAEVSPAWLASLRGATMPDPWVYGFAVLHQASNAVIGSAGFKGPPDEAGLVEIGYGIVPAYEGRGYATEAAAALVNFAFATEQVRLVRAHTRPLTNASTRVLAKCGFKHIGEVMDPDDGPVWRWERGEAPD